MGNGNKFLDPRSQSFLGRDGTNTPPPPVADANKEIRIAVQPNGSLAVVVTAGMGKLDTIGMLALAQTQIALHGPTGLIAPAPVMTPTEELNQVLAAQRAANGVPH